jgi:hypothetical protein
MEDSSARSGRVAELQYSPDYARLELTLPFGTKVAELAKLRERLFSEDIIGKLPRGCPNCISGESLLIRERLEHVVRVDLERMEVLEGP